MNAPAFLAPRANIETLYAGHPAALGFWDAQWFAPCFADQQARIAKGQGPHFGNRATVELALSQRLGFAMDALPDLPAVLDTACDWKRAGLTHARTFSFYTRHLELRRGALVHSYTGPPPIQRNEPFKVLALPRSIYDPAHAAAYLIVQHDKYPERPRYLALQDAKRWGEIPHGPRRDAKRVNRVTD
jgi:hypothetical protein